MSARARSAVIDGPNERPFIILLIIVNMRTFSKLSIMMKEENINKVLLRTYKRKLILVNRFRFDGT